MNIITNSPSMSYQQTSIKFIVGGRNKKSIFERKCHNCAHRTSVEEINSLIIISLGVPLICFCCYILKIKKDGKIIKENFKKIVEACQIVFS